MWGTLFGLACMIGAGVCYGMWLAAVNIVAGALVCRRRNPNRLFESRRIRYFVHAVFSAPRDSLEVFERSPMAIP